MSLIAFSATFELAIPNRTAKLVALALADHHNQSTGKCFPGIETLMRHASASRATVFRALLWLEERKYIKREQRRDDNARQTTSFFKLLYLEPGWQSQNETPTNQPFSEVEGSHFETGEGLTGETGEGLTGETPINRKKEREEGTREGRKAKDASAEPPLQLADPTPKKSRAAQGRLLESVSQPAPEDIAFEEYRQAAARTNLINPRDLSSTRRTALKWLIQEHGLDGWREALANAERSAFCQGRNHRGWRLGLGDMLKEEVFLRLLEGAYDNKLAAVSGGSVGAEEKPADMPESVWRVILEDRAASRRRGG